MCKFDKNFKIGSWNLWEGIKSVQNKDTFLNDLAKYSISMVCLQETHCNVMNIHIIILFLELSQLIFKIIDKKKLIV